MQDIIVKRKLVDGWQMKPSSSEHGGREISNPSFDSADWYNCRVPTTVLGALTLLGKVPDPYYADNLQQIDPTNFSSSWWFRNTFSGQDLQTNTVLLGFEGVNYQAEIWLNGEKVLNSPIKGPFRQFVVDITAWLSKWKNVLALEVFPAKPGDFNLGFVDWNPPPPDRSMGIFRPVYFHAIRGASIRSPFVETTALADDCKTAALKVHCLLENHSSEILHGELQGTLLEQRFHQHITLQPFEKRKVVLSPDEFPFLYVYDPELWWPYQMGTPTLHELLLAFVVDGKTADLNRSRFGIRKVDDYITPEGHRGFKVNHKSLLIKGAGWTDDIFLRDTEASLKSQISYVRHMNLNCIRLEGFWGKDQTLYDLCDEHGILIMAGWSCQWEHEQYLGMEVHPRYGGITAPVDIENMADSWRDQLLWLRHHPSIFVWTVASDMVPHPALETKYRQIFREYDQTRPYLNSTGGIGSEQGIVTSTEIISEISGSSRVKMLGPYAYTPPIYWYTNQNLGGAYGFNTETCPGANIPEIESLRKMLPSEKLWPVNELWEYHTALNSFSTLERVTEAIDRRYGPSDDVETFSQKVQMLNYELMRPMFEAFQANRPRSTGIIQWMLNSAWTSMYWQLYDAYLHPTAAFYATRKACDPLHLIYNYGSESVVLINEFMHPVDGYSARVKVLDLNGKIISFSDFGVLPTSGLSTELCKIPHVGEDMVFLHLDLRNRQGESKAQNFYWLSAQRDELDYDAKVEGWSYFTPSKSYANYQAIAKMTPLEVELSATFYVEDGTKKLSIRLKNTQNFLAFFIYVEVLDKADGNSLLPIYLSDNYISILPGDAAVLIASFSPFQYIPSELEIRISGWNVNAKSQDVILSTSDHKLENKK